LTFFLNGIPAVQKPWVAMASQHWQHQ
jgi:hypothetical protein